MLSRHRSLLLLALPLALAACGAPAPSGQEANPYAGGVSYPWSYTAPAGQLTSQTLTAEENTLQYEPILSATNGWGPVEKNRSNGEQAAGDGRTLTIGGRTFAQGLGVHAPSDVRYSLKGTNGAQCTRFTAYVGVDDEVGDRGSVQFEVYLDGVRVYTPPLGGVLTGAASAQRVDLDITGKQELRLVVKDGGDNIDYDHADWADPRITCVAGNTTPAGTLDPAFGNNGRAAVSGVDAARAPDGTTVVLSPTFGVTRLSADGAVLGSGSVTLGSPPAASALAVQPDGRIVVAGSSDGQFTVVRYGTDLRPDPSFGTGGVAVVDLSPSTAPEVAYDVAVQPDGKIVVVGDVSRPASPQAPDSFQGDIAVLRLNADGTRDAGFGAQGAVFTDNPFKRNLTTEEHADGVAVQPDGRVVVVGTSQVGGAGSALALRYLPGGALDPSFGQGGSVGIGGLYDALNDVLVQPDGRIVAVGRTGRAFDIQGTVVRLNADGSGAGGANLQFSSQLYAASVLSTVAALPGGKLLVGGVVTFPPSPSNPAVARLNPDLTLDPTFGPTRSGFSLLTGLDSSAVTALVPQPDGLVVALTSAQGTVRVLP